MGLLPYVNSITMDIHLSIFYSDDQSSNNLLVTKLIRIIVLGDPSASAGVELGPGTVF